MMTASIRTAALTLAALVPASAALAQGDTIHWTDGTRTAKVRVSGFTINEVSYQQGGAKTRSSDEVAKIELGEQRDVYKRGYASKDPGQFLNVARELISSNKAGDVVMGQIGFVEASKLFYDEYNEAAKADRGAR